MEQSMTRTIDDPGDLRQRLKDDDEQALAESFLRHRERLWGIVHFRLDSRLQGRVDPEDVLQDAYLNATQRVGHYREDSPASEFLWLRMIVIQTLIDVHRTHLGAQMRDARREVPMPGRMYPQATSASLASQLIGHLTSPSQVAMRAELSDQLAQAIAQMDSLDQEILALRNFEELSNHEAAAILGIQVNAASMRYVRALKRLQEILSRFPGFCEEAHHA